MDGERLRKGTSTVITNYSQNRLRTAERNGKRKMSEESLKKGTCTVCIPDSVFGERCCSFESEERHVHCVSWVADQGSEGRITGIRVELPIFTHSHTVALPSVFSTNEMPLPRTGARAQARTRRSQTAANGEALEAAD